MKTRKLDPRAIYGGLEPGQCQVCVTSVTTDPYCKNCGREVPPLEGMCGNFIQDGDEWTRCVFKKKHKGMHRASGLAWSTAKGSEWEDEFPEHYKSE